MLTSERDRILYEIAAVTELANMAAGDPVMELPFRQKIEELYSLMEEKEADQPEASARLYFFGEPVKGSIGIEAGFLSEALAPFQQMVSARVSKKWNISVRRKGRIKDLNDSTLYLTSLPRGSFGVELRKLTNVHISHESHLSESIKEVIAMIESAKSEEQFQETAHTATPRELSAMRKWFSSLKKGSAGVTLESGPLHVEFNKDEVDLAYRIITSIQTELSNIEMIGRFRGALLDRRTYDFMDNSDNLVNGPVSEDLTEDELEEFNRDLIDVECIGYFQKQSITVYGEPGKSSFILTGLERRWPL